MQTGSDCRILCMESQNNETRDLYKKLVDANVLIRTYGTKKNDFSNLRGQFKDNHSGESCLLVDKIMVNGKNKYKVIAMDNKYMIQVMKKSFDEVFEKGKNPLIKLICFDMGGVYFDGDFIRDFLQQINTNLSQNIKPRHDHEKNVIESKKLGFQAIQYHGDIEKLKTDLKEKGIKI